MTTAIDKHEEFWFEDGNLILLVRNLMTVRVDGVYFNVHRDQLQRRCGVFKDMLSIPSGIQSGTPEGGSVERPVHVPDVSFGDFEAILEDVYTSGRFDPSAHSVTDLRRIIQVAKRLQANGLAAHIASYLMGILPPLSRLSLCYEIDFAVIQEFLAAQEQENSSRMAHRAGRVARRRSQANNEPTSPTGTAQSPRGSSSDTSWLLVAFSDLVLDFSVPAPFKDEEWPLDNELRWHVVIARDKIFTQRCEKVEEESKWQSNFDQLETFAITRLVHTNRSDMKNCLEVKRRWFGGDELKSHNLDILINRFIPSDEDERKVIFQYCVSAGLG